MTEKLTVREAPTARAAPARGRNITLWVLQGIAAAGFLFGAFGKLTGYPAAIEVFESMGTAGWLPYLIAPLEVLGAIALVIPRLRLYGLASAAFVTLTIGAVLCHLVWGGNAMSAAFLLVVSAVIAWGRRSQTAGLVSGVLRRTGAAR